MRERVRPEVRARWLAVWLIAGAPLVLAPLAWAAPAPLTAADAEAAAAAGLHAKAAAIYLEIYERTDDRALLPPAVRAWLATHTPSGRARAAAVAQRYLASAQGREQEQEATALLAETEPPRPEAPAGAATDAGAAPSGSAPAAGTTAPPAAVSAAPTAPAPGGPLPAQGAPALVGPYGGPPAREWVAPQPWSEPRPALPPAARDVDGWRHPSVPGATAHGVPFAQRGRVGIELALGMASSNLREDGPLESHAAATVVANVPVARTSFFEARVPLSLVRAFGSPTFGVHHVADVADGVWITAGGAMGFPMVVGDEPYRELAYPRALWDAHFYYGPMFPLQAKLGVEYHAGLFGLRLLLEPSLWVLVKQRGSVGGALPHALELQVGHEIGAGARLQGVLASTDDERGRGPVLEDAYQLALNPYFVVHHAAAALRIGMMLPFDEALGPPFERSFGLLVDAAVNLD